MEQEHPKVRTRAWRHSLVCRHRRASSRHFLSFSFRRYHLLLGCLSCRIFPGLALSFQPRLLCGCEFAPGPPRLNIFFCWASGVRSVRPRRARSDCLSSSSESFTLGLGPRTKTNPCLNKAVAGITLCRIRFRRRPLSPWSNQFSLVPPLRVSSQGLVPLDKTSAIRVDDVCDDLMHLAGPSSSLPQAG